MIAMLFITPKKSLSAFQALFVNLCTWLVHVRCNNQESTEHMLWENAVKQKQNKTKTPATTSKLISFISVTQNMNTHLFSSCV